MGYSAHETGMGWGGIGVIVVVLIAWVIWGRDNQYNNAYNGCGNGCISNCEVQKQEIIDNLENRYFAEKNTSRIIDNNNDNTSRIIDQSRNQYIEGLQTQLFDFKINGLESRVLQGQENLAKDNEIALLKKQLDDNSKFNSLRHGQEAIECMLRNLPQIPQFYADGEFFPRGGCGRGHDCFA